jgi:SagB-type dehydrogenase family enzyme
MIGPKNSVRHFRASYDLQRHANSSLMVQRSTLLRRARSLFAYWKGRRLFFYNFATRLTVSGRPLTCEVLDFFSGWKSSQKAITHFNDYSQSSVRSALRELVKHGLLLRKNSAKTKLDSRIANEWSAWLPEGSFHFCTKDGTYIPANWSVDRLMAILPKTPQPKFFKSVAGAKKIRLRSQTFPDSEFIRVLMARRTHRRFSDKELALTDVSQLLSLVWGVTGFLQSPIFGKLPLKTSPSGGARHPGEVYLMALRVRGLRVGLYHYHPVHHYLERISTRVTRDKAWLYCAGQDHAKEAAALFLMTAVFPRSMWKYNRPRAYRVVLLDAGHLCQTFCLVATWLGLAPFCTAAFKDTLIEQDLRIDGIRESILYVAGVGLPAISARAKQRFSRNVDLRAMSPSKDEA